MTTDPPCLDDDLPCPQVYADGQCLQPAQDRADEQNADASIRLPHRVFPTRQTVLRSGIEGRGRLSPKCGADDEAESRRSPQAVRQAPKIAPGSR